MTPTPDTYLPRHLLCLAALFCCGMADDALADEHRVTADLQMFYDFRDDDGVVRDRSDVGVPSNLTIVDSGAAEQGDGKLRISKPSVIRSDAAPIKLINAVSQSQEISVEVWCQPRDVAQAGPARLLTISTDSSNRNLTLGQDGDKFDVRLRTTKTNLNGIPSVASPKNSLQSKLTHVVYTRQKNGTARIFINGKQQVEKRVAGDLKNWDRSYRLALADEINGGRPWLGELHLVAIYSRALSVKDVRQNFAAGSEGRPSVEVLAMRQQREASRHFETAVAPLLSKHCLECHDSASREGGLDLSKKVAAFEGGDGGISIVPGRSADSELWLSVESDAMPHDRSPLSSAEKSVLKQWIDDGAVWSLDAIDPAIYSHGSQNQGFVQRLTVDEYIQTVKVAVNVDIAAEAKKLLPADLRADGFSNTAYNLNVDLKHVGAYSRLAETVVSRMDVVKFVKRFSSRRKFTDADMKDVITKVGRWILRGPVSNQELIAYRGITTTVASTGGDFEEAMTYLLEAMLQSPRFLYRVEQQRGDGGLVSATEYELASRLSYMLWGGPPDEELFKLSATGQLSGQLQSQAERMLKDDRAVHQSLRFVADWLDLERLKNLRPNAARFPEWNAELADHMRRETLAYFEDVVWNQRLPLTALLNAQVTFATPQLAKFYGLDVGVDRDTAGGLGRYDVSEVASRGGLLTQGSVLTVGGDHASMVTRGLLVMHELLRGVVKDPPPCVNTTPIATKAGVTQRSIAMERISNASCGGCHKRFEPLAFGLERFDGLGTWHERDEHGNELRDDGEMLVPGTAEPVKYRSSQELMDLLAASDRVALSLTWKVTQFAAGRPLVAEDASMVNQIHQASQAEGGTWTALMTAIVTSDLVKKTRTVVDRP